jgi:hypothetical protein
VTAPLVLLDVDGVFNALGDDGEHVSVWPEWQTGWALADGTRWPITWAPAAVERLRSWHEDGLVEIEWLTTWGHDANGELRDLLGLPHLAVAGTYEDEGEAGAASFSGAGSHAAVAPAAPDPLSGRWWKYDVVRRVLAAQPDRLVVWIDDELHRPGPFRTWAEQQPHLRVIGPAPMIGLSETDLAGLSLLLRST